MQGRLKAGWKRVWARKMDHVFFSILGLCLNHQSLSLSQSLLSLEKKNVIRVSMRACVCV